MQALVSNYDHKTLAECFQAMSTERCTEFADELFRAPMLFGAIVVSSWTESCSIMDDAFKVLDALQLQLPGVEDGLIETKCIIEWLLHLAKGQVRYRLLKGLCHIVSELYIFIMVYGCLLK